MLVILQGGERRQCEPPGALLQAWPITQGGMDPALQPPPACPGWQRPAAPRCQHALLSSCLQLAETGNASLVHSRPCTSLAHSLVSHGNAPDTAFK